MDDELHFPSFSPQGEEKLIDHVFEMECNNRLKDIISRLDGASIKCVYFTKNDEFGRICRADFATEDDSEEQLNLIILWKNNKNNLVEFIGFDLPKHR